MEFINQSYTSQLLNVVPVKICIKLRLFPYITVHVISM